MKTKMLTDEERENVLAADRQAAADVYAETAPWEIAP